MVGLSWKLKPGEGTDFEKILIENFDQEALSELAKTFASSDFQEVLKFLKEKNVIEENTVRGGQGKGAIDTRKRIKLDFKFKGPDTAIIQNGPFENSFIIRSSGGNDFHRVTEEGDTLQGVTPIVSDRNNPFNDK